MPEPARAVAPRLAVFRTDASPSIGGGHVMRCLSLADALAERGWRCAFAVGAGSAEAVPALGASRHELTAVDPGHDERRALTSRWPEGCDLLVVDRYGSSRDDEAPYRGWARRILVLDDLADRPHDCDVLLDPNPAHAEAYADLTPPGCTLLTGPSWAVLHERYAALRRCDRVAPRSRLKRVVIGFGMTDRYGLSALAVEALSRAGLEVEADVVIGSASGQVDTVRKAAAGRPGVRIHVDCDRVAELMAEADLAIGACGTSVWERCCLGLPSVVAVTADNQSRTAAVLGDCGAAIVAGSRETIDADRMAHPLRALADDPERLARMSRAAFGLCDGHGAHRLAALLEDTRARGGGRVWLRPATGADAAEILAWQSHPDTRRYFRDPRVPSADEHRRWLADRLAAPGGLFNVIQHDGADAGMVRLDLRESPDTFEVSILTAPSWRGLGVARAALSQLRAMLPGAALVAEVHPDNVVSRRLFEGAGYRFDGELWRQIPAARHTYATEGAA